MNRALALACALLAAPAFSQTWTELGPAPIDDSGGYAGRISALATSATDANLYYAGAADGGVWKSADGGASWMPLTDHMPTTSIGAIAIDPSDHDVIYAGTGEANYANHSRYGLGIFKSTDGGQTWQHLAHGTFAGRTFSRIVVDPTDRDTVYAAVARAGGFPALAAAKGHPGANGPVGVFKSIDGGVSWTHLTNGIPGVEASDVAIDRSTPSTVYAAIGNIFGDAGNGIYKSTNAGASWTRLTSGLPTSNVGRISIDVSPSSPQTLYALYAAASSQSGGGAANIGGFRSNDGGATWFARGVVDQATYGWYLSCVAIKPDDPNTVFYGGLAMRRYVGNSGSDVTPPHVDLHALAWDAAGRLLVGGDGGVHRSANLGNSWISLANNLGTTQLYAGISTHPSNDEFIIGGFQDNGTCRRAGTTTAWQHVFGGDGGWTQVDQASPNRVFCEFQGTGGLYRSTDGGTNFNFSGNGLDGRNCFLPPYVIDPNNPSVMYYATERVYRSTNGGSNWSPRSPDLTDGAGAIRALAIASSNSSYLYASTNDGNVLASTNGGQSFTLILDDHAGWPRVTRELTVDPTNPNVVYLATAFFGTTQVRRSTDAGQTWLPLDANLPDIPVNVVEVDTRTSPPILYVGTDAGLYRSIDDGGSWAPYLTGLPNACVIDIVLDPARDRLIVATQGRGTWLAPIINCPADLDSDGDTDADDFFIYLDLFAAGDARADLDGDGDRDADDFFRYLDLFAQGC